MDPADRPRLEDEVRALCARGDFAGAATRALRSYGPELLGFLVAVHGNEGDAGDAFSEVSEVLWRKLPEFAWESTLRTWAYTIAHRVSSTLKRNQARRDRRLVRGSESAAEGVAMAVRTATFAYLRTDKKTRLQALRDTLPVEDRMLLVLRVDRDLAWNELARVMASTEGEPPPDGEALAREAARLRKRFQLVKDKLREMAKRDGLLDD